jgi:hypothetical protein
MNGKFITREEALKRLQMTGEQLDALVTEGELRAFRDGGAIRFKAEDIENLKKRSETEATVVLEGAKKAPPADDETSEVDLDSVEVEADADESDQTSILPLDVPGEKEEEAPVLELDEAPAKGPEGPSLAAVLEEAPTVERPKKRSKDSDITSGVMEEKVAETDHSIDLAAVSKAAGTSDTDVASDLMQIVAEEKKAEKGISGLLKAADKEAAAKPSVTAETVGLEPASAAELGTVAIEPVEAAAGTEETVPMEAAVEEITEPGAVEAVADVSAAGPAGFTMEDFLRDVEPESVAVKAGLLATGVVLAYSAIIVGNLCAGSNNILTSWLTGLVSKLIGS